MWWYVNTVMAMNRLFPSFLAPLFQNETKCETFHMKMSSACSFIFMRIKVIFKRMVLHLDSPWNRGIRELGNGLFLCSNLNGVQIFSDNQNVGKYIHGLVDHNFNILRNSDIHSYNTGRRNDFLLPLAKRSYGKQRRFYQCPKEWNT